MPDILAFLDDEGRVFKSADYRIERRETQAGGQTVESWWAVADVRGREIWRQVNAERARDADTS